MTSIEAQGFDYDPRVRSIAQAQQYLDETEGYQGYGIDVVGVPAPGDDFLGKDGVVYESEEGDFAGGADDARFILSRSDDDEGDSDAAELDDLVQDYEDLHAQYNNLANENARLKEQLADREDDLAYEATESEGWYTKWREANDESQKHESRVWELEDFRDEMLRAYAKLYKDRDEITFTLVPSPLPILPMISGL